MKTFLLQICVGLTLILASCQKEISRSNKADNSKEFSLKDTAQGGSKVKRSDTTIAFESDYGNDLWDKCSNEYVHIKGEIRIIYSSFTNADSSKIISWGRRVYQNVTATGDSSGLVYTMKERMKDAGTEIWAGEYYTTQKYQFDSKIELSVEGLNNDLLFEHYYAIEYDKDGNLILNVDKFIYDECN